MERKRNPESALNGVRKGFTLVELIIAGCLLVVLGLVVVNNVLSRQGQAQIGQAKQMIASDVPNALTQIYYSSGRVYSSLPATAAGAAALASHGVATTMPWGDNWNIQVAGSATNPPTITIRYNMTNARNPAQMISSLTAAGVLSSTSNMITGAVSNVANTLDVTYINPR